LEEGGGGIWFVRGGTRTSKKKRGEKNKTRALEKATSYERTSVGTHEEKIKKKREIPGKVCGWDTDGFKSDGNV